MTESDDDLPISHSLGGERKLKTGLRRGIPLDKTLRQWRYYRMLTQAELGTMAGVSPVAISLIESGANYASFATVRKLAEGLGISVEQLRYEHPPRKQELTEVSPHGNDASDVS